MSLRLVGIALVYIVKPLRQVKWIYAVISRGFAAASRGVRSGRNSQSIAAEKENFELATSGGFFVYIFTAIKWETRREDKKHLCWCE